MYMDCLLYTSKSVLDKKMMETLEKEALPVSRKACRIVPASLGELIGDYAAVSVGIKAYQDLYRNAERDVYKRQEELCLMRKRGKRFVFMILGLSLIHI